MILMAILSTAISREEIFISPDQLNYQIEEIKTLNMQWELEESWKQDIQKELQEVDKKLEKF